MSVFSPFYSFPRLSAACCTLSCAIVTAACASGTDAPLGDDGSGRQGDGGAENQDDQGSEPPAEVAIVADGDGAHGPDEVGFVGAWSEDAGPGSEVELSFVDGNVCLRGQTGPIEDGDYRTYWGAEATLSLCADEEGEPQPVSECLGSRATSDLVGFGFTLSGDTIPSRVVVFFNEAEREDANFVRVQAAGEKKVLISQAENFDSTAPATSPSRIESVSFRATGSFDEPQPFEFCVENFRALFGDEWEVVEAPAWLDETDGPGQQVDYAGANLVGAEFGESQLPGKYGVDYYWPGDHDVEQYVAKGMNVFRIPFRWERMQPALEQPLDEQQLGYLKDVIAAAKDNDATIIVDPHNFARYVDPDSGEELLVGVDLDVGSFADFWARIASEFPNDDHVWFGLMNEPHDMETEIWVEAANAALAAIRNEGANNLVLVPGNQWTGAHAWFANYYGTPNAEALLDIEDPADNYAFELHQYFDANYSGTSDNCVSETIGVEQVEPVTEWLREYGFVGFLGEFGGSDDPVCLGAVDNLLSHLGDNSDVWLGWTVWAATEWGIQHNIRPGPDGEDTLQMRVLLRHMDPP